MIRSRGALTCATAANNPISTHVVAGEVVNRSLGQHGVVLQLRLAERRGVAGNDDQLGLARAQRLHGRLGTQGDLTRLHHQSEPGVDLNCSVSNPILSRPIATISPAVGVLDSRCRNPSWTSCWGPSLRFEVRDLKFV